MVAVLFLVLLVASQQISCFHSAEQQFLGKVPLPKRVHASQHTASFPFEIRSAFPSLQSPSGHSAVDHTNMRRHLSGRTGRKTVADVTAVGDPVFERAVAQLNGQTRGVQGFINIWSPFVDQSSEYSLSMVRVVGGTSGNENVVEAGVHVFPERYGDSRPRVFVTWTADGFQKTGCYNTDCVGFVELGNGTRVGSVVSVVSKTNSTQVGLTFLVFQDKSTGNWFFFLEGNLVGLWPAKLFNSFSKGGTITQFGGEISNVRSKSRHTGTDMGSGAFAARGLGFAAFIRDIRFVNESNFLVEADNAVTEADTPTCYSISSILSGTDPLNSFFFYGGPGQNSACK